MSSACALMSSGEIHRWCPNFAVVVSLCLVVISVLGPRADGRASYLSEGTHGYPNIVELGLMRLRVDRLENISVPDKAAEVDELLTIIDLLNQRFVDILKHMRFPFQGSVFLHFVGRYAYGHADWRHGWVICFRNPCQGLGLLYNRFSWSQNLNSVTDNRLGLACDKSEVVWGIDTYSRSLFIHDYFGLPLNRAQGAQGGPNSTYSNEDQEHRWEVCGTKKAAEVAIRFAGGCYCLIFGCLFIRYDTFKLGRIHGPTLVGLGLAAFLFPPYYTSDCENNKQRPPVFSKPYRHSGNTVPQQYPLTSLNYWGTVIGIGDTPMANVLSTEKQTAIIGALAEGSSIRSIERQTGVHRDTIMRLGVGVGKGCQTLLDQTLRCAPAMAAGIERDFWTVGDLVKAAA